MGDSILTDDGSSVFKPGGYMVRKHAVYHREDFYAFTNASHNAEEVDCGFETASEEARAGEEKVTNGGRGKVEGVVGRAGTLKDLLVEVKQVGAEKFALGSRDRGPEGREV